MTADPHVPRPIPHMQERHARRQRWLAGRDDPFSQLASRAMGSAVEDGRLVMRGQLTEAERDEVRRLAPSAAINLLAEREALTVELRGVLAPLDPLRTISQVTLSNLLVGAGEYFEPSFTGSEVAIEIVAGLYASQAPDGLTVPGPAEIEEITGLLSDLADVGTMLPSRRPLPGPSATGSASRR